MTNTITVNSFPDEITTTTNNNNSSNGNGSSSSNAYDPTTNTYVSDKGGKIKRKNKCKTK